MNYHGIIMLLSCAASSIVCAGAAVAEQVPPDGTVVGAAAASLTVDPATGNVTSIALADAQAEMAVPHPAGSEKPFAYLEVADLRDGRTYSPLTAKAAIEDWNTSAAGDAAAVTFRQRYAGAPFSITQTFRRSPVGVRWEATLRLLEGQDQNRSVRVSWVLPLPVGWRFWGPNSAEAHVTTGFAPYRFIYGHTDPARTATILPLVGVWGRGAGAAVFSPPDVRKCQILFEVFAQDLPDAPSGMFRHVEDLQSLKVAHHLVGLRPGKELNLAICIAGVRPDWRGVMGHYVHAYPELFEPIPAARKWEGMYGVTTPRAWEGSERRRGRRTREVLTGFHATCVEIHGHFLEYGYYIDDDVIAQPDKPFVCQPHPAGDLTCAGNRRLIAEMLEAGIGPFMYFYNVHALPDTIQSLFPGEMLLDERSRPAFQWYTEPAVVAQPDSAFGQNLMEQLRLLIQAYPEAPGFFVDNYAIQKVGFNHDDGVTMVHNRPAYDLNRNHQDIGTRCHEIAHAAGKVMMVNKLATIESARGVDMVLLEGVDAMSMAVTAFACPNRAFFPLIWDDPDRAHRTERGLQQLLLWGGTPGAEFAANDPDCMRAYRPLTDAMIGKRWVFDEDPLTLPAGYDGQIFRIDSHAPHAGDVVVTVVDLKRSWQDGKLTEDLAVTVRLPESEQLQKATWLAVAESADAPVACEMTREGRAITVKLPPVGAAGVLRLSR